MPPWSGLLKSCHHRKERRQEIQADIKEATQLIHAKLDGHEKIHLPEGESNKILACYGFPILPSRLVRSEDELEQTLSDIRPRRTNEDMLSRYLL